jgi:mRNA-degrading endonuclease toxin of MazEF toxin-antitoxin module
VQRGDIYQYQSISRARPVLLVSADALTAIGRPLILDITDVPPADARVLLAVEIPGHGYALIYNPARADPERFRQRLGAATPETMVSVNRALSVAFGLT